MTEWLHFHFSLSCTGEGNGNPLQCSGLENPRDGVAQSRTRLKWLSSSSSSPFTVAVYKWKLIKPWGIPLILSQPIGKHREEGLLFMNWLSRVKVSMLISTLSPHNFRKQRLFFINFWQEAWSAERAKGFSKATQSRMVFVGIQTRARVVLQPMS